MPEDWKKKEGEPNDSIWIVTEGDLLPSSAPAPDEEIRVSEGEKAITPPPLPVARRPAYYSVDALRDQIKDEALRFRLDVALYESLRQDMADVSEAMDKLVRMMEGKRLSPTRQIVKPGILLFPVPEWKDLSEGETVAFKVHSLRVGEEKTPHAQFALGEGLRHLHCFASGCERPNMKTAMGQAEKTNLVKALAVFFDEMTDAKLGMKDGLTVNFLLASASLEDTFFLPPDKRNLDTYEVAGRAPVVIDDLKLLEFQAKLRWYFEQKAREARGEVPMENTIDKLTIGSAGTSDLYWKNTTPPPSSTAALTGKKKSALLEWRRILNSFLGK